MANRQSVNSGVDWEKQYGYSRAVRVGDRILVSGTTAAGPEGEVAISDASGQARLAIDKIEKAIIELGGQLSNVVRTRVYVARMEDWKAVARIHGERFGRIRPVNTLVQAKLVGDEHLVEIEAEAIVGSG